MAKGANVDNTKAGWVVTCDVCNYTSRPYGKGAPFSPANRKALDALDLHKKKPSHTAKLRGSFGARLMGW